MDVVTRQVVWLFLYTPISDGHVWMGRLIYQWTGEVWLLTMVSHQGELLLDKLSSPGSGFSWETQWVVTQTSCSTSANSGVSLWRIIEQLTRLDVWLLYTPVAENGVWSRKVTEQLPRQVVYLSLRCLIRVLPGQVVWLLQQVLPHQEDLQSSYLDKFGFCIIV